MCFKSQEVVMPTGITGLTLKQFEKANLKDFGMRRTLLMSDAKMYEDEGQTFAQYSFETVPVGDEPARTYELLFYVEKRGEDWVITRNFTEEGPFYVYLLEKDRDKDDWDW
jgi:hypothetical protein